LCQNLPRRYTALSQEVLSRDPAKTNITAPGFWEYPGEARTLT
jgi:hypothetical protein